MHCLNCTVLKKKTGIHSVFHRFSYFCFTNSCFMKRILILGLFSLSLSLQAQVINFGKTLPVSSFSVGVAPTYNVDNFLYPGGMSYVVFAGYGLRYDIDLNVRYILYNDQDYLGIDMQYLFREARNSYFTFIGGLHKWHEFGADLTGTFTYTPRYQLNLSTGLDMDFDLGTEIEVRAWIPLNFGMNVTERMFVFLEYDLPMTERSWDILSGGLNFIIR